MACGLFHTGHVGGGTHVAGDITLKKAHVAVYATGQIKPEIKAIKDNPVCPA